MPATAFNDFSGGEAGTFDLAKITPNMWKGSNLVVYRDGSLGPRPGLRAFNLGRAPVGPISAFGYIGSQVIVGRELVYLDGTTLWSAADIGGNPVSLGAVSAAPTGTPAPPCPIIDVGGGEGYISVPNGGRSYKILPASAAVQDLNTTGGVTITQYGIRLLRSDTTGKRFYYSDRDNAFAWPAANFIDLLLKADIVYMAAQRTHLTICTNEGSWFVLTGIPGLDETLRRISGGHVEPAKISPACFVDLGDDEVYYLHPTGNHPARFDGVEVEEFPYLSMAPNEPTVSYADGDGRLLPWSQVKAFQATDNGSPAFVWRAQGTDPNLRNAMLLKHNGIWSRHQFGVPMSQEWASNGRGRIWGFDQGPTDTGLVVYTTNLKLDRPSFTSDLDAQPGDNSNIPVPAEATFREMWSDDGQPVRVTEVMVDFVRWNTGAPVTNRIQIEVAALGRNDAPDAVSNEVWEQAGFSSTAAQGGTRDRLTRNFGSQGAGAGWRLRLHGLRGVAIRQVTVFWEPVETDSRAWGG